ncbi:NYN domain-containing protein [Aliiroseovarius crassostreae]|uniref:NYN domain-containing protein n=1 Tax=Aliiroseovarius crassostreae TaxID=154981 RepID=UPI00220A4DA0|nr:NYN domain-containing protein [Aliiroseovarius crassostreae]UWQ05708.1 NYN domain-containing protein [Aliiroseovarius crassostreae]
MAKDDLSPAIRQVALLIDGENISSALAGKIIIEARRAGELTIRRVYGNAKRIPGWDEAPGIKLVHSGTGKNAADILLALEAMELCLDRRVTCVVLASSDGDFSHAATLLRERGVWVVGVGESKAPEHFRKSCSDWVTIASPPGENDRRVEEVFAANPAGLLIAQVNPNVVSQARVTLADFDEKTWRKYFEARPEKYQIEGSGQQTRIRLRT